MPVLHWIMFSNSCGQTWRQSRCKGPNIKLWAGAGAAGGRRVCTGFLLLRFVFRAGYNFHTSVPSFKCKNEIHQQHWETSLQESQTQSDTWLNLNLVWCWMWSEILQMGYIRVWHSWKFQHKHISKYIKNVHIINICYSGAMKKAWERERDICADSQTKYDTVLLWTVIYTALSRTVIIPRWIKADPGWPRWTKVDSGRSSGA